MNNKVLFLLRKNNSSGASYSDSVTTSKSGLLNSAILTAQALREELRMNVKVEVVVDGNSIDREVYNFKPKYCILEALWVTPDKMKEVARLHPKVTFIVRIHSEIPFLANEGIAMEFINGYKDISNVFVSFNERRTSDAFLELGTAAVYLPNIYSDVLPNRSIIQNIFDKLKYIKNYANGLSYPGHTLNVGCFGAIRPLKNQLIQATAAMIFADSTGTKLRFHINSSRVEQKGDSVLKNLIALFKDTNHELVEHPWYTHDEFLKVVKTMDLGMQVSFTETFNIITADFVSQGVPMVVSKEVNWMPDIAKAEVTSVKSIVGVIDEALFNKRYFINASLIALDDYNKHALRNWQKIIR